MKNTFLHFALPLAFVAALPLVDAVDNMPHHPHGQEMAMHMPPPALAPWESVKMDGFREERMNSEKTHAIHFDAARAALKMTTMHMAQQAVAAASANDEDMDLDFNLEYGLADLGANSTVADADLDNEFSLENKLTDLSNGITAADAEINAQFASGK